MNKVFIILGPTSSGKTALAVDLCKKYGGEIVSVDSRQIYKYMDIGTGKIPICSVEEVLKRDFVWEIDSVNIWGYDLVKPDEYFSSYEYAVFALQKLRDIFRKEKNAFVTGGTGFYIDTITKKVNPSFIGPDFELRAELKNLGVKELIERLKALDKKILMKIDTKNPVRLIRAIEKLTKNNINPAKLSYLKNTTYYFLGLTAPRVFLFARADQWAEEVWDRGLVGETKVLIKMGYKESPKLKGLVYKSVVSFLDRKLTKAEAIQRIKFDIHAYIRRQQTYLKKNTEIVWFDISKENYQKNIYNFIEEKMKNG
jgi:tRNA dimethylallyltransferase